MQKCKIGIIAFGTVGKGIFKILKSTNDLHPILKNIEIVGIAVKNINKNWYGMFNILKNRNCFY